MIEQRTKYIYIYITKIMNGIFNTTMAGDTDNSQKIAGIKMNNFYLHKKRRSYKIQL